MGSVTTPDSHASAAFHVKRIAIIGAGPSGLAVAKYLLAQGDAFERVDIYEQQAEVGGVWNYSAKPASAGRLRVPQTDAVHAPAETSVLPEPESAPEDDYEFDSDEEGCSVPGSGQCSRPQEVTKGSQKQPPLFPSPMYDHLHTNIPHTLMQYSDLEFPNDREIFPSRQVVQDYLVRYSQDVRYLIKFSTQVVEVSLRNDQSQHPIQDQWDVHTKDLLTNSTSNSTYDAVVVASGHYSTAYIPGPNPNPGHPSMAGIEAFNAAHPGVITHSKLYRSPSVFRNKKVVVVGTGASGLDIAAQIKTVCKPPILVSARSRAAPETLAHLGPGVEEVGEISQFRVQDRGVEFRALGADDGGEPRLERDVDAVLFCTGYLYTFPFLPSLSLSLASVEADPPLITDGRRVHGLARHLLHIVHPTLAFPGLPMKVIPFPLAEAQGAVLARLWSNALPLPARDELRDWERRDGERGEEGKGFHVFPKGGDARYINEMHEWAMQSNMGAGGMEGKGKEPLFWGDEELWQRSIYAQAKMQFEKTGRRAKTLEELGFRYDAPGDLKVKGPIWM
ncbi:Uu.00g089720.m01.CDS01 [Anthostomella pinea]|uniref:Uu.00g089720.m01.CDS01 n=1 Tax=Anthostomella pinea TaxID=933095 RepID=A0AAI8YK34_9PEZI|nr:Uu.00g089720.m01.CDS01 [Anthostomella pinea]